MWVPKGLVKEGLTGLNTPTCVTINVRQFDYNLITRVDWCKNAADSEESMIFGMIMRYTITNNF